MLRGKCVIVWSNRAMLFVNDIMLYHNGVMLRSKGAMLWVKRVELWSEKVVLWSKVDMPQGRRVMQWGSCCAQRGFPRC